MHIPVRHLEITGAPSCAAFDVSLREGASIVVPGILPRRISGPRIASSADLGLGGMTHSHREFNHRFAVFDRPGICRLLPDEICLESWGARRVGRLPDSRSKGVKQSRPLR
jgi:hypothetical protein